MMSSLPHIAYIVSRPRQEIDKGENDGVQAGCGFCVYDWMMTQVQVPTCPQVKRLAMDVQEGA